MPTPRSLVSLHFLRLHWFVAALSFAWLAGSAHAGTFVTYVTGEVGETHVVFRVIFDPAVPGSAVVTPILAEPSLRMDGIDFLPDSTTEVAVGAQVGEDGGAIPTFDVSAGVRLDDLVSDTNAVAPSPPGASRPSTVLSTSTHVYYIENQFGFAGGLHRIRRTPLAGPVDAADVVFDGGAMGALGLKNFEGLALVGERLYLFAEDHAMPMFRALYSIHLDGTGLWDGAAPIKHLGMLTEGPAGDGSDELDYDPIAGMLYGTNIIGGEIIVYDPVGLTGGFLISPAAIGMAPPGSKLARLATGMLDGIRANRDGYLVVVGLDGVILSIDLAGVAAGLGEEDIRVLYDDELTPNGYRFDDLTPLTDCYLATRIVDGPDRDMNGAPDTEIPVQGTSASEYTLEIAYRCPDVAAAIEEIIPPGWDVVSATADDGADRVVVRSIAFPTLPHGYRHTLVRWVPADDGGVLTIVLRTRKHSRTTYEPHAAGTTLLNRGAEVKTPIRVPVTDEFGNPLVGRQFSVQAVAPPPSKPTAARTRSK
jgi:hypothetical protein